MRVVVRLCVRPCVLGAAVCACGCAAVCSALRAGCGCACDWLCGCVFGPVCWVRWCVLRALYLAVAVQGGPHAGLQVVEGDGLQDVQVVGHLVPHRP